MHRSSACVLLSFDRSYFQLYNSCVCLSMSSRVGVLRLTAKVLVQKVTTTWGYEEVVAEGSQQLVDCRTVSVCPPCCRRLIAVFDAERICMLSCTFRYKLSTDIQFASCSKKDFFHYSALLFNNFRGLEICLESWFLELLEVWRIFVNNAVHHIETEQAVKLLDERWYTFSHFSFSMSYGWCIHI